MNDRIPGSSWSNPIWHGKWRIYLSYLSGTHGYKYEFVHDDYDGADDANDGRCGVAMTVENAKIQIDEMEDYANSEIDKAIGIN
jgi:hypothetical protein